MNEGMAGLLGKYFEGCGERCVRRLSAPFERRFAFEREPLTPTKDLRLRVTVHLSLGLGLRGKGKGKG